MISLLEEALSLNMSAPQNPHMPILPQSNLHLDILMGRDETLECADFMTPGVYPPPIDLVTGPRVVLETNISSRLATQHKSSAKRSPRSRSLSSQRRFV